MNKRQLKKCSQCEELIPKKHNRSWGKYLLQKYCSQPCANRGLQKEAKIRLALENKPDIQAPMRYRDYLRKHADQL